MKHLSISLVALFTTLNTFAKELESKVANLIESSSKNHPRLFISKDSSKAIKAKISADQSLAVAYAKFLAEANNIKSLEPITFQKEGRRLLGVSRLCLRRVIHLGFAYQMTADLTYARRAEKEMLAAARFDNWNPSHFLDVAEMTAALGIGYDWLFETLSKDSRKIIKNAILEKGLKEGLKGGWWVDTHNNWNQVCHAGLTIGALAIMKEEPQFTIKTIQNAVKNLPHAMAQYSPDGGYPEGPGYWGYGTYYNVLLIAALESALGSDLDLSKEKGFLEASDYYLHATGPTQLLFNYSDTSSLAGFSPAMYWFAKKRKRPDLLWNEQIKFKAFINKKEHKGFSPFMFIWWPDQKVSKPKSLKWSSSGPASVAMHRSG